MHSSPSSAVAPPSRPRNATLRTDRCWGTATMSSSLLSPFLAPCPAPPTGAPALIVGATSCPVFRLGAVSPRMLSRSRRIGGLLDQSPKSARAKTRRRLCATPNHCASRVDHSTNASSPAAQPSVPQPLGGVTVVPGSKPASASTTAAKSRPLLLEKAPGTFSQRANRSPQCFRSQPTIRMAVKNSPDRAP